MRSLSHDYTLTVELPRVVKIDTNCRVKPSRSMDKAQIPEAASMYGLRRPIEDLEWSAMEPELKGWEKSFR